MDFNDRRNRNPNQQALPGMENLSHPGAKVLADHPAGMFFHSGPDEFDPKASVSFREKNNQPSNNDYTSLGSMSWKAGPEGRGAVASSHIDADHRQQCGGSLVGGQPPDAALRQASAISGPAPGRGL